MTGRTSPSPELAGRAPAIPLPPAGGALAGSMGTDSRRRLLGGLPVRERRVELAGISTAVLEGGDGPPVVLLHGPGESAVNWRWILPQLVRTHRVVAPDLPGHGDTDVGDAGRVHDWLADLLEQACPSPPALVGHVLGGAIAARFAIAAGDRLGRLVLVDSLGLARFRPAPRFAAGLVGFALRPNERSHDRFMGQCAYDLDTLRDRMGHEWPAFVDHNLALARSPKAKAAGSLMRTLGIPRIPDELLARIGVPVALIWGRHDRANRLRVAERASALHGWPLHVVEQAADDPMRDQPEAFMRELDAALSGRGPQR